MDSLEGAGSTTCTSLRPTSICIATPMVRGVVTANYVRSVFDFQAICVRNGIGVELNQVCHVSVIDDARNILTNHFLADTSCSHMLFVDDDMGFNASELFDVLEVGDRDVVAVMSPKRSVDWERVKQAVLRNPSIDPDVLAHLVGDYNGMFHLKDDGAQLVVGRDLIELNAIGAGIMLISRQCLLRLIARGAVTVQDKSNSLPGGLGKKEFYEFFRADRNRGEDIGFCQLVRTHGGGIFGSPWVTVTHTGSHDFIGDLKGIAEFCD